MVVVADLNLGNRSKHKKFYLIYLIHNHIRLIRLGSKGYLPVTKVKSKKIKVFKKQI